MKKTFWFIVMIASFIVLCIGIPVLNGDELTLRNIAPFVVYWSFCAIVAIPVLRWLVRK